MTVAIRGLCNGLAGEDESGIGHEVFIQVGSSYYYTESKLYVGATCCQSAIEGQSWSREDLL